MKSLFSKRFLKHFLIAVFVAALLLWGGFKFLDVYTRHGDTVPVPQFSGVSVDSIANYANENDVSFEIVDSLYDESKPAGVVFDQDPKPAEPVKVGRTIYLYVTAKVPPNISMPRLVDRSLRQAVAMLESYGLKKGNVKFVPDLCVNCVIKQLYKGELIKEGTNLPKNATIDLVVGKGLGDEEVPVPRLIGMSREEAVMKLAEASLREGFIKYENDEDTIGAKVYRQIPGPSKENYVNIGSSIDIYLSTNEELWNQPIDTAVVDSSTNE